MTEILKRIDLTSIIQETSPSISELFHENTKLHPTFTPTASPPATEYSYSELRAMINAKKSYPYSRRIALPSSDKTEIGFEQVVRGRRTVRNFAATSMSIELLSWLLSMSNGVTSEAPPSGGMYPHFRASPSAGGLYPAEIYLFARNVTSLTRGLYYFSPDHHELVELSCRDVSESVWEGCCRQDYAKQAAVIVFFTGVFQRTKRKYGERGYRYVLLDVGHLAQNLCLAATARGQAIMTTCGFFDDQINDLVGADGIDESALYVAFVGPRSEDDEGGHHTD